MPCMLVFLRSMPIALHACELCASLMVQYLTCCYRSADPRYLTPKSASGSADVKLMQDFSNVPSSEAGSLSKLCVGKSAQKNGFLEAWLSYMRF